MGLVGVETLKGEEHMTDLRGKDGKALENMSPDTDAWKWSHMFGYRGSLVIQALRVNGFAVFVVILKHWELCIVPMRRVFITQSVNGLG
jgi:hypothetical protein